MLSVKIKIFGCILVLVSQLALQNSSLEASGRTKQTCGVSLTTVGAVAFILYASLNQSGCGVFTDTDKAHSSQPSIFFSEFGMVGMPKNAPLSEKTGFADFNGDGTQDMILINDEVWIGQDYGARIFPGRKGNAGILQFGGAFHTKIPITVSGSYYKFETAQLTSDKVADLALVQFYQPLLNADHLVVSLVRNLGDGTGFSQPQHFQFGGKANVKPGMTYVPSGNFDLLVEMKAHQGDGEAGTKEYFRTDFGDVNGDGTDDLLIFRRTNQKDLWLAVYFTSYNSDQDSWTFTQGPITKLEGFIRRFTLNDVDTEDVNGDGLLDIVAVSLEQTEARVKTLIQYKGDPNQVNFVVEPETRYKDTFQFDRIEKTDLLDVNGDGRADIVTKAKMNHMPVLFYRLSSMAETSEPVSYPDPNSVPMQEIPRRKPE